MFYTFFSLHNERRRIEHANQVIFPSSFWPGAYYENYHELCLVLEGEGGMRIENETFNLSSGDVIIRGQELAFHSTLPWSAGTSLIGITPNVCTGDFSSAAPPEEKENSIVLPSYIKTHGDQNIERAFKNVSNCFRSGKYVLASSYLNVLLNELSNFCKRGEKQLGEKICEYIASEINRPIKTLDIASHFHVSRKTAENAFKQYCNTSIHQYIMRLKLENAKYYLEVFSSAKLSEISAMLGFYDEYHLSKQFKARFGISPLEYKKKFSSR